MTWNSPSVVGLKLVASGPLSYSWGFKWFIGSSTETAHLFAFGTYGIVKVREVASVGWRGGFRIPIRSKSTEQ